MSDVSDTLLWIGGLWLLAKLTEDVLVPAQAAMQQGGVDMFAALHPGSRYPVASHRGVDRRDAVYATAVRAGFPDPDLATAIALAESGGNPAAVTQEPRGGESIGLWQIYLVAHPQYSKTDMLDARKNAAAAFAISNGGTNWQPWSVWKSGAYQRYMP